MAAPVTNIVGVSFVDIASTRMANLQATMDAVLAAENGILNPILKALFLIYIGRQFLLTMTGNLTMDRFFGTVVRSGIIILLVTHSGAFVQYVRDPVFNKIPQAMSNMVAGNYAATAAGQPMAAQFDAIAAKGDAVTADIDKIASNWFSKGDWIACLGPPMLCLEIFERTRGFVDQWVGKIVGMAAFGFATSFVLALLMNGMKTMFDAVKAQTTANATAAAGMFWHVIGDCVLDLLTMASLPLAVGFGSGAVAALAAPSALLAMRSLTLASGGVSAAASRTARALSRMAYSGRGGNS